MKTITLNQGPLVLVDDENYELLRRYSWNLHPKGYAARTDAQAQRQVLMHRQIMDFPTTGCVDHLDANKLNNQRNNLRVVSVGLNTQRGGLRRNNTTGFVGVGWDSRLSMYRTTIKVAGRHIELGRFRALRKAVAAYNEAAIEHFGETAYINEIPV